MLLELIMIRLAHGKHAGPSGQPAA
jgi:hypothetical protein